MDPESKSDTILPRSIIAETLKDDAATRNYFITVEKIQQEVGFIKDFANQKYAGWKAITESPDGKMTSVMSQMRDFARKAYDHALGAASSAVTVIQAQGAKALENIQDYLDTEPRKDR